MLFSPTPPQVQSNNSVGQDRLRYWDGPHWCCCSVKIQNVMPGQVDRPPGQDRGLPLLGACPPQITLFISKENLEINKACLYDQEVTQTCWGHQVVVLIGMLGTTGLFLSQSFIQKTRASLLNICASSCSLLLSPPHTLIHHSVLIILCQVQILTLLNIILILHNQVVWCPLETRVTNSCLRNPRRFGGSMWVEQCFGGKGTQGC